MGGETDGRPGGDWGVHRVLGKPGGTILGSTTHRVERSGTHAGAQHTRAGKVSDMDTGQSGLERIGRGEGDSDRVTKHQVEAAGGTEAALCALQQGNFEFRVLQETKLMRGIHTRYRVG